MDRLINYPGAQALESDLLFTNLYAMKGLGHLAYALFGSGPTATGFSLSASSPAALTLALAPGSFYQLSSVDSTPYSSLGADTTHNVIKQGISENQQTLSFPAPGTSGQSINYLVQAQFVEQDAGILVLPYYNSANPAISLPGPGGSGTSQPTVRQGTVQVSVKAGAAAITGSQVTPSPDSGFSPLWQVTVAYGATTLSAANATLAANSILSQYTLSGNGAMLRYLAQQASLSPNPSDSTQLYAAVLAIIGANALKRSNNFSDLGSLSTALANLGFAVSFSNPGYIKLPLGGIIQFGYNVASLAEGSFTFTFPAAFPNACNILIPTVINNSLSTSQDVWAQWDRSRTTTTTGAVFLQWDGQPSNAADGYAWIAGGN